MFQAIILEDDILSSWGYEMILDELNVCCIGKFKSWKKALPFIKNKLPDFIILDLLLDNNENGFDFLNELQNFFIPCIVVSGYLKPDIIDQAIAQNVVAFVPKPLDKTLFIFQVKKLITELSANNYDKNHFIIQTNKKIVKIPQEEILMVEIDGNYSVIKLESGKKFVIKLSLVKVMHKLNPQKFIRCYRSMIININKITSFDMLNNTLLLTNGQKIKVGSKYKASIKKEIQKN